MTEKFLVDELWILFQHIQNKGLDICSMYTLCEKHKESIQHLFFECANTFLMWWQMIIVTWGVSLTEMSSSIVMPNMKFFLKKKKLWTL